MCLGRAIAVTAAVCPEAFDCMYLLLWGNTTFIVFNELSETTSLSTGELQDNLWTNPRFIFIGHFLVCLSSVHFIDLNLLFCNVFEIKLFLLNLFCGGVFKGSFLLLTSPKKPAGNYLAKTLYKGISLL